MGRLRIILAEDHVMVREGLKLLVNAQPDMAVVAEAGDGVEAVDLCRQLAPDLAVLDISLPEQSGLETARQLRAGFPGLKVLALTVHEDRGYVRQLFEAGISGYVVKRSAADELINAIRIVAAGGVYIDPAVAGKIVPNQGADGPEPGELAEDLLSQREVEVLRLIARGFSNKEIAIQLNISAKTVETYKSRAMEKTVLFSRADIVRFAIQNGWLID